MHPLLVLVPDKNLIHICNLHPTNMYACIMQAGVCSRVALVQGSCARMPLPRNSVDVLVCDMPFGKMFGSVEDNKVLYPRMLGEAAKVVKPGGRAVLLTSDDNADLMQQQVCSC